MIDLPQYLYLDSKIVGAAQQITEFFKQGVFSEKTTVLLKYYKHPSHKRILAVFQASGVSVKVVRNSDLDNLTEGIVFYPFNAQSNCRLVANRKLTHIFITHGESNKISSVKPILRIYDYVATAGDAGIDRLLQHKIFTPCDIEQGRLIKTGDTFIGKTGLNAEAEEKVIFYAPTWEGGVPNENYSSLCNIRLVSQYLLQACRHYHLNHVVIRPHPNTGHRLDEYQQNLWQLINELRNRKIQVSLYIGQIKFNFWQKIRLSKIDVRLIGQLSSFAAELAFCDLSAIETQLLNEQIPYYIFGTEKHYTTLFYKKHNEIYQQSFLDISKEMKELDIVSSQDFIELKNYVLQQHGIIGVKQLITSLM